MNSDKQLRQDVIDELDFEPSIDSADIGVQAEGNVITLTGHVPTYAQKLAAERAIWRVKGVKAVVQNIVVRPTGEPTSDEEIAKRALRVLRWDSTVPDSIHLTISKGWLTLTGEAIWQFQRNNAENALRRLAGVVGISNNVAIKARPEVDAVKQRIEDALRRSAEVEAQQIQIDVKDAGTVTLDGKVDTWNERSAVERAAWSVPGVQSVVDRLTVG